MRCLLQLAACACALAAPAGALAAGDPLRGQQYGLDIIEADAAHAIATGKGATIAIIDTGVQASHPDLQGGRLLRGYDFVDNDATPEDDVDGHGTHVLGIAGADAGNGIGVSSVAPGAKLLPVRVLNDDGAGTVPDVVKGIDYAVAQGADVINLSLGGTVPLLGSDASFDAAIDRALDAGRVVVAAAGNDGLPACSQPSGRGRLLCVGSVDENRRRSLFSNFSGNSGASGVMAPGGSLFGRNILSTFNNRGYELLGGTSQAAPHVSGVAALLVEKGVRGGAAVRRILATASDAGAAGPDAEYGAGIVNARRAVTGLQGPAQPGPAQPGAGAIPRMDTADGSASAAGVFLRRALPIRRALRRGIHVRCRAAREGRCRVVASRHRKRVAAGSKALGAGRSNVTVARFNRRGRVQLRRALRRERAVVLRVRVTLPGAKPRLRRVKLRP
jgi:thermitase